jgi:hypothetical protein
METDADEPEDTEDDPTEGAGDWSDYPWRRSVAASHDKDDLDRWPCPACAHPLAFHAFHVSTSTSAFAKAHGADYRFSCDAWLFAGDGVGSCSDGDPNTSCPCEFHGIAEGRPWPREYRPLYLYLQPTPDVLNESEPAVRMTPEEWEPYEPSQRSLDRWA